MPNPFRCDVLVLGSGIAGLFYALRVAELGSVAIVTKKRAADSATNWAQGGIAAVQDGDDSFESHVQDTLVAGAGLCRAEVVERVVERGPAMIDALLKLGADFDVSASGRARPGASTSAARAATRTAASSTTATPPAARSSACCCRARAPTRTSRCSRTTAASICSPRASSGWRGPARAIGAYVLDVGRRAWCASRRA